MAKRPARYKKCQHCKMTVSASFECEDEKSCPNKNPTFSGPRAFYGKRGAPTLDIQEGNLEELA